MQSGCKGQADVAFCAKKAVGFSCSGWLCVEAGRLSAMLGIVPNEGVGEFDGKNK